MLLINYLHYDNIDNVRYNSNIAKYNKFNKRIVFDSKNDYSIIYNPLNLTTILRY